MQWPWKKTVQNITVIVNQVEVDEAVAKIEASIKKLDERKSALEKTIREAKSAKGEVESVIAQAMRRGRRGW